jgi:hypothetical protein
MGMKAGHVHQEAVTGVRDKPLGTGELIDKKQPRSLVFIDFVSPRIPRTSALGRLHFSGLATRSKHHIAKYTDRPMSIRLALY